MLFVTKLCPAAYFYLSVGDSKRAVTFPLAPFSLALSLSLSLRVSLTSLTLSATLAHFFSLFLPLVLEVSFYHYIIEKFCF